MDLRIPKQTDIPNFMVIDESFSILPFNNLRLKVNYINGTVDEYIRSDDNTSVNFTFYVINKNNQFVTQITKTFSYYNDNFYLKDLFSENFLNEDGTFKFNDYYFAVSRLSVKEELINK